MATVPDIKRLRAEDFPEDQQELVSKLAFALNSFMDQTVALLDGNLDSANIAREIKDINFTTDGSGAPSSLPLKITTSLNRKPVGVICIKAENLTNTLTYPSGAPWVSWTLSGGVISITNITNLTAGEKWRLRLMIIGEDQ